MNPDKEPTLDVARRILAELAEMTEHASLTRGLRGGEAAAAQAYNRALASFARTGTLPEGMFAPVDPEGAEYGLIGVQCRLLLAAIEGKKHRKKDDDEDGGFGELIALAPFVDSADLGRMVMERLGDRNSMPNGLLIGLAPFLDRGTMGEIMRRRSQAAPPPAAPAAPTPPATPSPTPDIEQRLSEHRSRIQRIRDLGEAEPDEAKREQFLRGADEMEQRAGEYERLLATTGQDTPIRADEPASLESLVETLKRPDLTAEDRGRIARRLAELAYDQSTRALG